jgi:hypothetical protein
MVGPHGCFFRAEGGATTLEPAHALVELHDAGITLVLVSGRTRPQLAEAAGIFGADGFIGELGAIVGWRGGLESRILRGEMPDSFERVPEYLLDELVRSHPGRLELHTPWHTGREVDVMLRGAIDVVDVDAWLVERGFGWLSMRDNGLIAPALMPDLDVAPHIYHLVPDGVSKGDAIAWDLERRGLARHEAIAIGDSASDLAMAPYVERLHLVANGLRHVEVASLLGAYDNIVVEDGALGAGWASAVRSAIGSVRTADSGAL